MSGKSRKDAVGWGVLGVLVAVLLWIGVMLWNPPPASARRVQDIVMAPGELERELVCAQLEQDCACRVLELRNPCPSAWRESCATWLKECEPCSTT